MTWTATTQPRLFATPSKGRTAITVHYPDGNGDTPTDLGAALVVAARTLAATGKAHLSDPNSWALTITPNAETIHQPTHSNSEPPPWIAVAINRLRENQ